MARSRLGLLSTVVLATHALAATRYVSVGDSIQSALDAASVGDTVSFNDGLYTGGYTIRKRLTIRPTNPRGALI